MAVRIRMKKMGRTHRPYFRICAMDQRSPRDGRVIEELGTYDPMCPETDARVTLKSERIDYWIGVGAQPSEKVAVLIQKVRHCWHAPGIATAGARAIEHTKELHTYLGTCQTSQEKEGRRSPRPSRCRRGACC